MRVKALFWAIFAAALALYLLIVLWSLPRIAAEAGGLVPFDMRPTGYDLDEARAFLTALTETGRALYLGTQHRLDLAYPALLAATFALGFMILFRGPLRWVLWVLALAVVGFDWLENHAVATLLRADPTTLDAATVAEAARWSVLKSVATTLAGLALLAGGIAALLRRRRAR
jgi:hypothetical protein